MPWLRSLLLLLLIGSGLAAAGDWPQWLGPTRNGVTPEKIAPWKEPPKLLWRMPVGEGHSSPVVVGSRVFLHTRVKDKDEEEITAFETKSGKELWRWSYPRAAFKSVFGLGPRATPAVSDGKLYAFGVTGVLTCLEAETGKMLWQVDTLKEFKAPNLFFGVSCSPLIEGEKVLVNVGGPGASVVAFGKDKGNVLWKALDDKASYSSPIAIGQGKERQIVFLTQQGLVGLSPTDGTAFWKFPLVDKLAESSTTPVLVGDTLIGSSVTYGAAALRLKTKDGKPGFTELWKNGALSCYFSTPVPVGKDHVYMVTGTILPPPAVTLRCVEVTTGKEVWNQPKVGKYHAALLRTGDDKLLLHDDGGQLILLEPNPKEYKELAKAKVCGATWAHPAIADGKLYVRDEKWLLCFQLGD
jgi:outer membrane protein assembly factor BamB